MANHGTTDTPASRVARLAAEIASGSCHLVVGSGEPDELADRIVRAARLVGWHLAPEPGTSGRRSMDYRAAAKAAGELVTALHVMAVHHPCRVTRRQVRRAGMLQVMIVELGVAAERNRTGTSSSDASPSPKVPAAAGRA